MAYGASIFNDSGDLAFSDSWASIVHLATLSPRNYGSMNVPAGFADFEIPDGLPDDVIPFVSYVGSNPSCVTPVVVSVVNQGHNYCALYRNSAGNLGLLPTASMTPFTQGTIKLWTIQLNKGFTNASSSSNLTMTFSGVWTTWGFPSTVTVSNIPANSSTLVVARMIAQQLRAVAGVNVSVNFSPNNANSPGALITMLPNEKMGDLIGSSTTPAISGSWSAAPASGLTFSSGSSNGYFYGASNHCIIPAIGDVIRSGGVEYTITGLSGTPAIADVFSLDMFMGVTLTTTPALPSTTTVQNYRLRSVKRYVRVWTGNVPSETPNHRVYLFGKIQATAGTGYGMRMYNAQGEVTFDSNQRMLVLSGRGVTPDTLLNYPDSSGLIATLTLTEGTVPTNYAIYSPWLGGGTTSYGSNPTGSTTTTKGCNLHLRRLSATEMGVYWANTYPYGNLAPQTGAVGRARLRWNVPFFIIDTTKYPSS